MQWLYTFNSLLSKNYLLSMECFDIWLQYFGCIRPIFQSNFSFESSNQQYKVSHIWNSVAKDNRQLLFPMVLQFLWFLQEAGSVPEIYCGNYAPQWWVELNDKLSWLFTKKIQSFLPYLQKIAKSFSKFLVFPLS